MNILWIKDNKKGHLKQVKALLDEIKKILNVNISEFEIEKKILKKSIPSSIVQSTHLVIGAGHSVYPYLLKSKKKNPDIKSVAILSPTYFKKRFDLICAPFHDMHKLNKHKHVLYFDGSLALKSNKKSDDKIGMIAIGGKNKYFKFDKENLIKQIQYIITLYPNKYWYIFNSRRTPKNFLSEIHEQLEFISKKITYVDHRDDSYKFDEYIEKSSIKIITPDSMSMIYESLSTNGETILFSLFPKKESKFLPIINNLKEMNSIGYIDQTFIDDINIYKTNLIKQKNFDKQDQTNELAKKIINYFQ
jgi:mitochondrial fission protein ELM1